MVVLAFLAQLWAIFLDWLGVSAPRRTASIFLDRGSCEAERLEAFPRGKKRLTKDDFDHLVRLRRRALTDAPSGHSDRAGLWSSLGAALLARAELSEGMSSVADAYADIEEAVQCQSLAVELMPRRRLHPYACRIYTNLSRAQLFKASYTFSLEDIRAALLAASDAAKRAPRELALPCQQALLLQWCVATARSKHADYLSSANPAELDEAIELFRGVLEKFVHGDPPPLAAFARVGLISALTERRRGEDLAEVWSLAAALFAHASPAFHPHALRARGVCIMLRASVQRAPDREALTQALDTLRRAVALSDTLPSGASRAHERASFVLDLAGALRDRYELYGDLSDLDESIDILRELLQYNDRADSPDHGSTLLRLGVALQIRCRRRRHPASLDEAITNLERACVLLTGSVEHANSLSSLGLALQIRYDDTQARSDLDRAIEVGSAALQQTKLTDRMFSGRASNLSLALRRRYELEQNEPDIQHAVRLARDAAAADEVPGGDGTYNLASALRRRGHDGDLEEANALDTAIASASELRPSTRFSAAIRWADSAASQDAWDEAATAYSLAVDLLKPLAWHGLTRAAREVLLHERRNLPAAAAEACLAASNPTRALVNLENARGVLWSQQLRLRTPLDDLRERDPAMYQRLEDLAAGLERTSDRERRQELAAAWDDLYAQAEAQSGLGPIMPEWTDVEFVEAASEGPVVVLTAGGRRSAALLVTRSGVRSFSLPGLSAVGAKDEVQEHLDDLHEITHAVDRAGLDEAEQGILRRIEWIRTTITDPIIDELERTGDLPGSGTSGARRIWWCPTGLLSLLPLHAAAHARVISSYTMTLRSLRDARRKTSSYATPPLSSLLIVAVPESHAEAHLPALPGVVEEAELLAQRFAGKHTMLLGAQARVASIMPALASHPFVHFCCHGMQNLNEPLQAALYLSDGPLSLLELAGLRVNGEFAFIAACETASAGLRLPDETSHLTAAMQLAGYRHVIGTLWTIPDGIMPRLTGELYRVLAPAGDIDTSRAAKALHDAVSAIRTDYPGKPSAWAAFAHFGP